MTQDASTQAESRTLQIARGLEEMAAWLREHPDFPISWASGATTIRWAGDHEEQRSRLREEFVRLADELDGTASRSYGDIEIRRTFAGDVDLTIRSNSALWDNVPSVPQPLPAELQRFAEVPS